MEELLRGAVLTIDSNLLPRITIPLDSSSSGESSGALSGLVAELQPSITLTRNGVTIATFAPAGEPTSSPVVWLVAVGAIGAALVLLAKGVRAWIPA